MLIKFDANEYLLLTMPEKKLVKGAPVVTQWHENIIS